VDKDCEFLEQEKIMDYSLLVGVHFRGKEDISASAGWLKTRILTWLCAFIEGAVDVDGEKLATPRLSRWDRDHFRSDPNR